MTRWRVAALSVAFSQFPSAELLAQGGGSGDAPRDRQLHGRRLRCV
jgi:hypothetical protein